MIKIGITGQTGFIGSHLYNFLGLKKSEVSRIPFQDDFFSDNDALDSFVGQCDVIVHLAALNRHNDPQAIYATNISLVNRLIDSLERTSSSPHLLFASSTQEERDNIFGKSKREGRELLASWAGRNGVLSPGCKPQCLRDLIGSLLYAVLQPFHSLPTMNNPIKRRQLN
jgi:UDP-2-acetamido-2,6-beta-L-arabino-hexul-4-ose reductase